VSLGILDDPCIRTSEHTILVARNNQNRYKVIRINHQGG
jgi:hypothetical protein